jgi:hypothetical protein
VRKLSITGSTEVDELVMGAAAQRIVRVSLELGGKSPTIVFPDANKDWVVDGIIAASLHAPAPVLHRRLAAVPARRHLRSVPRPAEGEDCGAQDRRPPGRGDR